MPYRRPGWTGKPLQYSDGKLDFEFSECPSCLAFHTASSTTCNGKRMFTNARCNNKVIYFRCERPRWHLGEHEAQDHFRNIRWRQNLEYLPISCLDL